MPHGRGSIRGAAARRAVFVRTLVVLLLLSLAPRLHADRRDQKAAELYLDGVELIKKGKYRDGIQKINAALERGATEPNEQQGTESRYLARRYDPYYWLGRAQMELGLFEQALANFEKSETIVPANSKVAVITKWPEEYGDLKKRKAELIARLQAAAPPPTAVPAMPAPTPVVIAALPTPRATAPPSATPTPFAVRVPTRPPLPPASPTPEGALERTELVALRARYDEWLRDPLVGEALRPALTPRRDALEALERKTNAKPKELAAALDAERRFERETFRPEARRRALAKALDAMAQQDFARATAASALARKADPEAPQPDLLDCAVLATRYLLEGKVDPIKIQGARERFAAWRTKVGPKRPVPAFLSPAIREALR